MINASSTGRAPSWSARACSRSAGTRYRDFLAAAQIRGTGNVGLVDALHVSTAVNAGVRYLVTNDARMPSVPGLEILRLQDLEQLGG